MAYKNGLPTRLDVIAELGPGYSVGTGLAGLLSGVNKYYAFDVVEYADMRTNLHVFNELLDMFKNRDGIWGENRLEPYLESYDFPSYILTDEHLNETLKPDRIESIKNALSNLGSRNENKSKINYYVPWYAPEVIEEESVDMIYSYNVLEHVDDLEQTYEALHRWLKPGGFMSHQIDFRCHGTAKEWNGHWAYSDITWRLIRGKRRWFLNRQPHSAHIELMLKSGFEIVCAIEFKDTSGIARKRLAPRCNSLSDDDLTTRAAFIQATKSINS